MKEVYSKKYLATITGILVGIATAVFVVSQVFVSCDTASNSDDSEYAGEAGVPYTTGPDTPPSVTPPTTPPPGA